MSVVIPTYNRADFLAEAVQSVFNQTYRPIELLIADDGSTDNTESVVKRFAEQAEDLPGLSVRYLYQSNRGAQAARNLGLMASKGCYVHHLDSDDILHPQSVEMKVRALKKTDAAFAWSPVQFFEDGELPQFEKETQNGHTCSLETTTVHCPTQASHPEAILFQREACRVIGPWYEPLERMQDWEYAFRIAGLRLKKTTVDIPLYYARHHEKESIGDVLERPEGVTVDLRSLSAIDDVVNASDPSPEMIYTAFWLYLKALQRALDLGTADEVRQCFRGMRRHSQNWMRTVRVAAVRGVFELLGPSVARILIQAYMQR